MIDGEDDPLEWHTQVLISTHWLDRFDCKYYQLYILIGQQAGLNKTHIINIPVEERKTESKSQQWNAKINDDDDDSTL